MRTALLTVILASSSITRQPAAPASTTAEAGGEAVFSPPCIVRVRMALASTQTRPQPPQSPAPQTPRSRSAHQAPPRTPETRRGAEAQSPRRPETARAPARRSTASGAPHLFLRVRGRPPAATGDTALRRGSAACPPRSKLRG